MTALEPGRDSPPPGDRLDQAVVIALGLTAAVLAIAGITSQRLGIPAALWVAAAGAVPLSLGMLLIAAERGRRGRESERIKRRETAAVLAEKLAEARSRAEFLGEAAVAGDEVGTVPYPTDEPVLELVPDLVEMEPVAAECSSIDRVAQLEETVVDLNRQLDELTQVIRGASRERPRARAGRHSGPPETSMETTGEPA